MIGKKLKVNDYKLTYGQETQIINMYGAFKNAKSGNKYAIYSYEKQNKLCYGSFFVRGNEAVIMKSKEEQSELIKEFVDYLLNEKENDKFEIISLDKIEAIQIIDEYISGEAVDLNKLDEITIPKPIVKEEKETNQKKKTVSIATICLTLLFLVIIAFFFVNPEVIIGKDKNYSCTKSYLHKKMPSSVTEEILLTFSGKGNITNIDLVTDYIFNDVEYYVEFKEKSYFYQYMEEGDSYKFIDDKYTYRIFSSINTKEEYFLPTEEKELIKHYQDKGYTCKVVDTNE